MKPWRPSICKEVGLNIWTWFVWIWALITFTVQEKDMCHFHDKRNWQTESIVCWTVGRIISPHFHSRFVRSPSSIFWWQCRSCGSESPDDRRCRRHWHPPPNRWPKRHGNKRLQRISPPLCDAPVLLSSTNIQTLIIFTSFKSQSGFFLLTDLHVVTGGVEFDPLHHTRSAFVIARLDHAVHPGVLQRLGWGEHTSRV